MLNLYAYIVCIIAVLSTAAGCLPSGPVSRQKPGEHPHHMMKKIPIHTGSLHNGLRYVINRTDIGDTVSVVAVVKAGSIYEQEHLGAGLSHFCEHIIHEGSTSSHSGKEYTRIVEKLGNHSNAYTSKDHTCYFITTTRDAWEDALRCISEWLFDCRFTEEEFTREKGVILREIEKSESEPRRILSKGLYETMFNEHPARYPVLGYKEIFQTVTRDELYSYYKRMYVPQHIVISISGRVNVDRADRYVKECFSSVYPSRGSLPVLSREPRQMGERKRTIIHEIKGGYLSMGFRTVTLDHPDLFALDLLSGILSGGDTGRITYTIREKKALAAGIGSYSYTPIYDAGIFGIWAEADPEHIEQIEEEVWTVLQDIEKNGVSAEEVRRVKRQIESSCLDDLKTSEDRAMSFGRSHMWTSNPLFDMYYLENIQNVTAEEIRNICGKYLTQDNLTTAYLLPPGNAAAA